MINWIKLKQLVTNCGRCIKFYNFWLLHCSITLTKLLPYSMILNNFFAVFVSNIFVSPGGYRQRQRYFVVQGGPWSSGNWALSGTHTSYLRHRQLPTNHCVQVGHIKQKSCPSHSWNSHSLVLIICRIVKVKFKHALST